MKKKKFVRKFNLDNEMEKALYEDVMNRDNATITREEFAYDKSRNNSALVTVWWEEHDAWSLDS